MQSQLGQAPSAPMPTSVAEAAAADAQAGDGAAAAASQTAEAARASGPVAHVQAAQMCKRIDACFSNLLPMKELSTGALPEGVEAADIKSQVKQLTDAAKWLDAYFQSLREQSQHPDEPAYEQEIEELEKELQVKDELLASCTGNIQEWKAKLEKLQAEHKERLEAI